MKRMMLAIAILSVMTLGIYDQALSYHLDDNEIKEDYKKVDAIEKNHPELADSIREYVRADKQLNFIYKELMDIYEKSSEYQDADKKSFCDKLKAAQLAWLKYRDLAVESELSLHESKREYYISMAVLTIQRTECIKNMLENMCDHFGGKGPYSFEDPAKAALDRFNKFKEEEK